MDILGKLGEVAKNMTEKAGDSLEINRINSEISIEKECIQIYQKELGEHFWAKFVVGETLDPEAMLICDKAVLRQDRIRELEAEIKEVKQNRAMVQSERALEKNAEESTDESVDHIIDSQEVKSLPSPPKYCTYCGGNLIEERDFCAFCGKTV